MNLKEWKESGLQLIQALRVRGEEDAFRRLLSDLYPDKAHFIYELFQNAEDTKADICRFTLSESGLEFVHNGTQLFSEENVKSITSFGNSTKRNDPTNIGKFGVGFKAVFAYTNTPEIHSGDFDFRIHDLVVPETDGVLHPKMGERETRFVFPFDNPEKPEKQAVAEVERGLRALGDNTLLFLSCIRKIEYLLPDGSLGSLERIDQSGGRIEIRASQPGNEETISHWLRFEKDVEVTDEHGKLKTCRIAIAYSLVEDEGKKGGITWKVASVRGETSIYFPASEEKPNLRFHLHAPFASTVARDVVRKESKANYALRDHLANLVVESLLEIRDQGMLTVDFLATLPNPQDTLPDFYEPIRKAIVEAFKSEMLTPTKSGSHAPAGVLYRGPARIQEVLDDDDLSQLTSHEAPLWTKNPPPQSKREEQFLESLEISQWGWGELAKVMSKPHSSEFLPEHVTANAKHKELIEHWLTEKDDYWMLRFYALLSECHDQHRMNFDTKGLRIVRVSSDDGKQHVQPGNAYFLPDGEKGEGATDVLFVKQAVYAIGRSESQKKSARSFLEYVGVKPYDAKAGVERILRKYPPKADIPLRTHFIHIKQFIRYWQENAKSTEMLKNTAFLIGEEGGGRTQYFKASDLYLDSPYIATGLEGLFNDNKLNVARPKRRLSNDYHSIKNFVEFVVALGAMQQLEICNYKATKMQKEHFPKIGRETASTVDEDYFINGFRWRRESSEGYIGQFDLGSRNSVALSYAVWRMMSSADPKFLSARYMPNEQRRHEEKRESSFLVGYLSSKAWVPDREGGFKLPADICIDNLHPEFKVDDRNGWLTAIRFGENTKKRSEEYQSRNRDAQKLGFASAEVAEEAANLLKKITLEEMRSFAARQTQHEFPEKKSSDQRLQRIIARAHEAPKKAASVKNRSVQEGYTEDKGDAKSYLRGEYTNHGDLFCQLSHQPMTFKLLNSEDWYFEAVECVPDTQCRYPENFLALSPHYAALFKYANHDRDRMRDLIRNAETHEIQVRLADDTYTLRYTSQHFEDLKAVLEVDAEIKK